MKGRGRVALTLTRLLTMCWHMHFPSFLSSTANCSSVTPLPVTSPPRPERSWGLCMRVVMYWRGWGSSPGSHSACTFGSHSESVHGSNTPDHTQTTHTRGRLQIWSLFTDNCPENTRTLPSSVIALRIQSSVLARFATKMLP